MVRYREILRLTAKGLSQRAVAESVGCAPSTVSAVAARCRQAGIGWPLPDEMDDAAIRARIYPSGSQGDAGRAPIDHERVERELGRRGVTMTLLWNEYCARAASSGLRPFQYSAFCGRHREWAKRRAATMHIEWRPAEYMQVDWAGMTMPLCDPDGGGFSKSYVFVAALPFSAKVYAEAFRKMDERSWVEAHVHAFEHFGGTTPIVAPDNLKTGIKKNTVEGLVVNEQYRRMCEHYNVAVVPARVKRPRDKASVEMSVGVVERRVLAPLRDRAFFSLGELNAAISEGVAAVCAEPFQKREGSRDSVFEAVERPLLQPLPPGRYEMVERREATVAFNYHISFDGRYYSVPFSLVRRRVEVSATRDLVWVTCNGERVASHPRSHGPRGSYVTSRDHMPEAHRDFVEWDGDRFRRWAAEVGPNTERVVDGMLRSRKVEQQSYRSCRALMSIAERKGGALLEEACSKALIYSPGPSYKTVKGIAAALAEQAPADGSGHAFVRGAGYYGSLEGGE